jgi:flagellin-like protein
MYVFNIMKNKRGVSPVIATVLLISIVIVIGVIIFFWARAFLSESAVKNERAVEVSCADVKFESVIVDDSCGANNDGLDINNIGNIPIYGFKILEWEDSTGSVLVDEPISGGTITTGKSAVICFNRNVASQDAFRIIPKLLAENDEGVRVPYTCPEKDGITIAYIGN